MKITELATETQKPDTSVLILFDLEDLIVGKTIVNAEIAKVFAIETAYAGVSANPDVALAVLETKKASIAGQSVPHVEMFDVSGLRLKKLRGG